MNQQPMSIDGILVELDARNRVSLNRLDPERAWHKRYMMRERPDGVIELEPVDVVRRGLAGGVADIQTVTRASDADIRINDQRNGLYDAEEDEFLARAW